MVRLLRFMLLFPAFIGATGCIHCGMARADMIWGLNGHPLVSYPGVSFEQQLNLIENLGASYYRVDITTITKIEGLKNLVAMGKERNIKILPILLPPADYRKMEANELYEKSFAFAKYFADRLPEIEVWELGNELENYAIIQPCELRDDGSQYPCSWGPAGGVGPSEYYKPRYEKVAAILRGLLDGVRAGNISAKRAIGSAGWGHLGIFDRLQADKIDWEITVWHAYGPLNSWAFEHLSRLKKPIWVTEFNHTLGSQKDGEEGQAIGLKNMMVALKNYEKLYGVEAAFIYELLDEQYWAPSFEASMGLVKLEKTSSGSWKLGRPKLAYEAAKEMIHPPPVKSIK